MKQNTFDALVIESIPENRQRLRQATEHVSDFGKIVATESFEEAKKYLNIGKCFHIIFISDGFGSESVSEFIFLGKQTEGGEDSAFILLTNSSDREQISEYINNGVDGFLVPPYSVDSLVEISHIADKVKEERQEIRERSAVEFLVHDIITQLDRVAYIQKCKEDVTKSLDRLRNLCSAFKTFDEDKLDIYYDIAFEAFTTAPAKKSFSISYTGVSQRVRERLEEKILEEIAREESLKH